MRSGPSLLLAGLVPALAACAATSAGERGRYTPVPPIPVKAYELPSGGPQTISIAVMDCSEGCPVVSVMLDPDNYWQRTSEDSAYSGIAPDGLYASVEAAFLAQGFDDAEGVLEIVKDNSTACPQYLERGQVWFIHLGRGETGQWINYDSACVGSIDAMRAQKVTKALAEMSDLTHIFEGTVTLEDAMGDEE